MLESLDLLHLKKLVLISPYDEETHTAEEKFFQANGYHLVRSRSMEITSREKRTTHLRAKSIAFVGRTGMKRRMVC